MEKKEVGSEVVGWIGSIFIFLAYALNSFHVIEAKDILYQLLNAVGAAGIAYISFSKKAYQPGLLNIVWALIAIFATIKILF